MSRYYQPSYHGSNDYRKYKEERLNANNVNSSMTLKSQYQQTYNYKPMMVLDNKEHLQTFGQQDNITHNFQGESSNNNDYAYQSRELNRKSKPQNYESTQITLDDKLPNRYASRLKDYTSTKSKPIYPSYSQTQLTQNDTSNETYQNTYRMKSNSRMISKYEAAPEILANDNFQDVVISRRKNYDYVERKDAPSQQSYKSYNYTSKLNNPHQISQTDNFVAQHKNIQLKMPEQGLSRSKIQKRNYLPNNQTYQKTDNIPSYQTRNELIRQRLNLNSNTDSRSSSILRSNLKLSLQENQYPNPTERVSKYMPPTQNTPQKTQMTPKADRDLSEKRRKSLIEKSQMLKQKLNKLNTSSTKLLPNQENKEDQMKSSTQNQNQNITLQGYTPSKRYLPIKLQSNSQNQQPTDRSLSKKLDFDVNVKDPQNAQNYDTTLQESNRNYSRNYAKKNQRQPLQDPTPKDQNPFQNSKPNNLKSNDGPLKKIHELNQRINSRLQSILKNYG